MENSGKHQMIDNQIETLENDRKLKWKLVKCADDLPSQLQSIRTLRSLDCIRGYKENKQIPVESPFLLDLPWGKLIILPYIMNVRKARVNHPIFLPYMCGISTIHMGGF